MDIRELHKNGMSKLRKLTSKKVRITYNDGSMFVVPCTIGKQKIDLLKYYEIVGRDTKLFKIMVEDLIELGAPTSGFKFVEYDFVKYQVLEKSKNGVYDNIIILETRIHRDNLNE